MSGRHCSNHRRSCSCNNYCGYNNYGCGGGCGRYNNYYGCYGCGGGYGYGCGWGCSPLWIFLLLGFCCW